VEGADPTVGPALSAGEVLGEVVGLLEVGIGAVGVGAVKLLGVLIRLLSRPLAMRFADLVGDFIHHVVGLRRDLVYRNLSLTFPDKSQDEVRRIAGEVYRNIARTFIDVLRFPLIRSLDDVEALVDIDVSPGVCILKK